MKLNIPSKLHGRVRATTEVNTEIWLKSKLNLLIISYRRVLVPGVVHRRVLATT